MDPFFEDEFDEGTKTKLRIYRDYLRSWLPNWVLRTRGRCYIFDLFCGPGGDNAGNNGSPVIAVEEVRLQAERILASNELELILVFNDKNPEHIQKLSERLGDDVLDENGNHLAKILYRQEEFDELFPKIVPAVQETPCLMFLDQYGATQISDEVVKQIDTLQRADVLFFVASNFFARFGDQDEAKAVGISKETAQSSGPNQTHRMLANHFASLIPDMFIAPFSIRKKNLYGLIFGCHHYIGLEKFLEVCWKEDEANGEANFDIYEDNSYGAQAGLFSHTKLRVFREEFERKLLSGDFQSDADVYRHCLTNGFIATRHVRDIVERLRKEDVLSIQDESGQQLQVRLGKACLDDPRFLILSSGSNSQD